MDKSSGYDAIAADYINMRRSSTIGARNVRAWAQALRAGASILELGCGHGVMTAVLLAEGLGVHAVDGSPAMVAAMRERFPDVPVDCASVEESAFFGRTFDGVLAWGLMFLLTPDVQRSLIAKVAGALASGGQFLFTSPKQACAWNDSMTRLPSASLGRDGYQAALAAHGLTLIGEESDEGDNHYYLSAKA